VNETEKAAWIAARVAEIQAAVDEAFAPDDCATHHPPEGPNEDIGQ
jgi:hypothetical protein